MLTTDRLECISDAFDDTFVCHRTLTALIECDRHRETQRFSYDDVEQEADRLAALLQRANVEPGDRCAIVMENQSRWAITAIALFRIGAVIVPLDFKLDAGELGALIAHCKPKVLFVDAASAHRLRGQPEASEIAIVFSADPRERGGMSFVGASEPRVDNPLTAPIAWGTPSETKSVAVRRSREDVATIVYSSGTGGTPKGCMLTHGNYLAQAQALGRMYPMKTDDRYFSVLPTNHAIDFMCGFMLPLLFGASVVHQRTLRAQFLLPTMRRYEVSHMAVVPRLLEAIADKLRDKIDELGSVQRAAIKALVDVNEIATLKTPSHRVSSTLLKPIHDAFGGKLRLMVCGGAYTDPADARFMYRLGLPVAIGYGMTEAGTVLTVNDLKPFRADTVGKPIDGTELKLHEPNDDGVGEVWVRGATVMKGYLDAPKLTAETIVDGWLHTGDLGRIDAAGHLVLVGRTRNMIVTAGGKNIYPEDVEAQLRGLASCEEYCVLASGFIWSDVKLGDEELVLVIRAEVDKADDDELDETEDVEASSDEAAGDETGSADQQRARSELAVADAARRNLKLASHQRVARVVVINDEFPRTASLKVKRRALAVLVRAVAPRPNDAHALGMGTDSTEQV